MLKHASLIVAIALAIFIALGVCVLLPNPQVEFGLRAFRDAVSQSEITALRKGESLRRYFDKEGAEVGHEIFHQGGAVAKQVHLKNGKKNGKSISWDWDGTKLESVEYKDDVLDGTWMDWDHKGRLEGASVFAKGEGVRLLRHPNGKIKLQESFKSNVRDGMHLDYYESGRLRNILKYTMGHYSGVSVAFHPDGKIRVWGRFAERGELDGIVVFADTLSAIKVSVWKNGDEIWSSTKGGKIPPGYEADDLLPEKAYNRLEVPAEYFPFMTQ